MILNGLFTQIIILILAVGIVFLYVQPAFSTIGVIQDDIAVYQVEREKVASVNAQLQALVDKTPAVSAEDRVALLTYMPDQVDLVAVPRDIQTIAERAGVAFRSVATVPSQRVTGDEDKVDITVTTPHVFQVSVEGSYAQIKNFFLLLERNNYPLDVQTLNMRPLEGGFMEAILELVAHGHLPAPEQSEPVNRSR